MENTASTPRPVIDTARIPRHVAEDLGRAGLEAFRAFKKALEKDPEAARRFQERVEAYRREKRGEDA